MRSIVTTTLVLCGLALTTHAQVSQGDAKSGSNGSVGESTTSARKNTRKQKLMSDAWSLSSFELSELYATQGSGKGSYSGMLAWTPGWWLNDSFALRANLGISGLREQDGTSNTSVFTVLDYELLARFIVMTEWDVEIGGGGQSWVNQGGANGIGTVAVGYDPKLHMFGSIDRVFVSYSDYALKNHSANEIRAGIGAMF